MGAEDSAEDIAVCSEVSAEATEDLVEDLVEAMGVSAVDTEALAEAMEASVEAMGDLAEETTAGSEGVLEVSVEGMEVETHTAVCTAVQAAVLTPDWADLEDFRGVDSVDTEVEVTVLTAVDCFIHVCSFCKLLFHFDIINMFQTGLDSLGRSQKSPKSHIKNMTVANLHKQLNEK